MASGQIVRDVVWEAQRGLQDGHLALRDVIGLSDTELAALRWVGHAYLKARDAAGAAKVHGLLATIDPLEPAHWIDLAETHERANSQLGALVCWEVVALLRGRDQTSVACQARSLAALGLDALGRTVAGYARAFALFGSNGMGSGQRDLRA